MAELVVIGYKDEATANQVMSTLEKLQRDLVIQVAGAAVVVSGEDGKLKMVTPTHATGQGAASGALWGTIIGMLFLMPFAGAAIGGAMGALMGKGADVGIKSEFIQQVQGLTVTPGTAAVVILFTKVTADKALEALAPFGGELLKSSLSNDAEERIQAAISEAAKA
jgi:uncharacterized membrane protein